MYTKDQTAAATYLSSVASRSKVELNSEHHNSRYRYHAVITYNYTVIMIPYMITTTNRNTIKTTRQTTHIAVNSARS